MNEVNAGLGRTDQDEFLQSKGPTYHSGFDRVE